MFKLVMRLLRKELTFLYVTVSSVFPLFIISDSLGSLLRQLRDTLLLCLFSELAKLLRVEVLHFIND